MIKKLQKKIQDFLGITTLHMYWLRVSENVSVQTNVLLDLKKELKSINQKLHNLDGDIVRIMDKQLEVKSGINCESAKKNISTKCKNATRQKSKKINVVKKALHVNNKKCFQKTLSQARKRSTKKSD